MTLNPQPIPRRRSSNLLLGDNLNTTTTSPPQIALVCTLHSKPAQHICTSRYCHKRILCPECQLAHPENHSKSITPVYEVTGPDIHMEIEEEIYMNRMLEQKNETYMSFISQVQLSFQEIKKRIDKTIEKLSIKFKEKAYQHVIDPLFFTKDWENFKSTLNEKKANLLKCDITSQPKCLDEYMAIYFDATNALADSNNARELTRRQERSSLDPLAMDQECIDETIVNIRTMLNKLYFNICQQFCPVNSPEDNIEASKNIVKPYKSSLAAFHLTPFHTRPMNASFQKKASSVTSINALKEKTLLDKSMSSKANTENPWLRGTEFDEVLSRKTTAAFIYDEYVPTEILDLPHVGPIKLEDGSTYKGQMRKGKPCGKGKQVWKDGRVFEGYFQDGIIEGKGRMTHPDSDIYEGQWMNNVACGKGKYIRADGWIYDGEWVDDQPHGSGMEVWPDGTKYEGIYKNGLKHGKGMLKCYDGAWYQGEFRENMFDGEGTYLWPDGRKYEGKWVKNVREGRGVMTWPDGRRYGGEFVADKRHGYGAYDWGDGKKYTGHWKDGRPHGQGRLMNANGEILEGEWRDGRLGNNGQYAAISIKDLKTLRESGMNKSVELSDYSRQSVDKMTLRGLENSNQMDFPGAANNYSVRSVVVDGLGDRRREKSPPAKHVRPELKLQIKGNETNKQPVKKEEIKDQKMTKMELPIKDQRRMSGYKIQIHEKTS